MPCVSPVQNINVRQCFEKNTQKHSKNNGKSGKFVTLWVIFAPGSQSLPLLVTNYAWCCGALLMALVVFAAMLFAALYQKALFLGRNSLFVQGKCQLFVQGGKLRYFIFGKAA